MNVYIPPQRREIVAERRGIHSHVRNFLKTKGFEVISRTGGNRSLPWLDRAGAMVLETNEITREDQNECLYMAWALGRQVLVLYDVRNAVPGGEPGAELIDASRRDGNEDSNLWLVRHTPIAADRFTVVNSALRVFARVDLD